MGDGQFRLGGDTTLDGEFRAQQAQQAQLQEMQDRASLVEILFETQNETIESAQERQAPPWRPNQLKSLQERASTRRVLSSKEAQEERLYKLPPTEIDQLAKDFHDDNPELEEDKLKEFIELLSPEAKPREILQKASLEWNDHFLMDEALEFTLQGTKGTLQAAVKAAKEQHLQDFGSLVQRAKDVAREWKSDAERARNGLTTATRFSELGSLKELRQWYTNLNLRQQGDLTSSELFQKMQERFGINKMIPAIHFYLKLLGSDFRNKGLSREECNDKFHQVQVLQAIIQMILSCSLRMRVVPYAMNYYKNNGMKAEFPLNFTYKKMAMTLMQLVKQKYLNPDIVLQTIRNQLISTDRDESSEAAPAMKSSYTGRPVIPSVSQDSQEQSIILSVILEQLCAVIKEVDSDRIFPSATQREQAQQVLVKCLDEFYSELYATEPFDWSEGLEKLGASSEEGAGQDLALKALHEDEELKEFVGFLSEHVGEPIPTSSK